jgi:hypothetical protein
VPARVQEQLRVSVPIPCLDLAAASPLARDSAPVQLSAACNERVHVPGDRPH